MFCKVENILHNRTQNAGVVLHVNIKSIDCFECYCIELCCFTWSCTLGLVPSDSSICNSSRRPLLRSEGSIDISQKIIESLHIRRTDDS